MAAPRLRAEHLSKKFCTSLRQSVLYGLGDALSHVLRRRARTHALRKGEFWALDDVSFDLEPGKTLGVLGVNGAGKTTLLRVLGGIIAPDTGSVRAQGRIGSLLALGAGFHPLLTGRQNVYLQAALQGMSHSETQRNFSRIAAFADLGEFLDVPVKYYSNGMSLRLGFAVAAHSRPDILLVDEVLAVGDEGFQLKCFNAIGELKQNGTAVVLVSHNMHVVSLFADHALFLRKGRGEYFAESSRAVAAYRASFGDGLPREIEKVVQGTDDFIVRDVTIPKRALRPGESFELTVRYDAGRDYADITVDTAITVGGELGTYFQASSPAYRTTLSVSRGTGELSLAVKDIPLADVKARIAIAVWARNKSELLFWWKIPVSFSGAAFSTGNNFLRMEYTNRTIA